MNASYDPNFPPNLCIQPSDPCAFCVRHHTGKVTAAAAVEAAAGTARLNTDADEWDQQASIQKYGIAGKVW
jgi:hypothetical protein